MKNNKKLYLAILSLLLLIGNASFAAKEKKYVLSSPDGTLKVEISAGNELAYQVMHGNDTILSHSNIGLVLENGTIVGKTPRITGERRRKIKDNIESPFYRFKEFVATGNELDLKLKGGFGIIFSPSFNPSYALEVQPGNTLMEFIAISADELSKAWISPLPAPSSTISMKIPQATAKPVRNVRNLLRFIVPNIS